MWNFQAVDNWRTISLHDCRLTNIVKQNDNIILNFSDGFWIVETNKQNPHKKTLRTNDNSQLTLIKSACSRILVEEHKTFPAVWREITWNEFCKNINSGKWEFECIRELYAYSQECIYQGEIFSDKAPFHVGCQIEFEFLKILYEWNIICEDRPW